MQALRNLSKSSTTFRRSRPAPARDPPAEEHVVGQHEAMGGEEATLEALIQVLGVSLHRAVLGSATGPTGEVWDINYTEFHLFIYKVKAECHIWQPYVQMNVCGQITACLFLCPPGPKGATAKHLESSLPLLAPPTEA